MKVRTSRVSSGSRVESRTVSRDNAHLNKALMGSTDKASIPWFRSYHRIGCGYGLES
jgi:hypothetical protein